MSAYRKEGNFEKPYGTMNGIAMLFVLILLIVAAVPLLAFFRHPAVIAAAAIAIVLIAPGFFMLQPNQAGVLTLFGDYGFFMLQPNQAGVLTLFGDYLGTERRPGLRWVWPWILRKKLSARARNHSVETLKVNDKRGNPIEMATFDVDDFEQFVHVQSESALRHVASHYNYDEYEDHDRDEVTLRAGADIVADAIREELQARVQLAGLKVEEAKITHLAYAPEIAGAMLRRQQAEAVIAARVKIVAGAVGMVEMALQDLSEKKVVELDDERRAAMVSNLMVVLCSERDTQPIVNAGTLYT
jgi:regulator of protease activity HflC (stomatin/prohibitin superfamily)